MPTHAHTFWRRSAATERSPTSDLRRSGPGVKYIVKCATRALDFYRTFQLKHEVSLAVWLYTKNLLA